MTPEELLRDYVSSPSLSHTFELIADDAVYWFSDGTSHVGRQEVEAAITRNFESIKDDDYDVHNVDWLVKTSETAVCIFDFSWSGTVRGEAASGAGRGTCVMVRKDGTWVIAHEHLSRGGHRIQGD